MNPLDKDVRHVLLLPPLLLLPGGVVEVGVRGVMNAEEWLYCKERMAAANAYLVPYDFDFDFRSELPCLDIL